MKYWKYALLSSIIIAIPFIFWDELFTRNSIWGFNEDFLIGWYLANLPIEEVLFFIVVPFACLFIYQCVKYYFKTYNLKKLNLIFYIGFFVFSLIIGEIGIKGWYPRIAISLGLILLIYMFVKRNIYPFFPLAFLFSMVPFFMVNGILTGTFLEAPIVWYSENEFSGVRFLTIPAEDIIYAWDLLVLNAIIFDLLLRKKVKS